MKKLQKLLHKKGKRIKQSCLSIRFFDDGSGRVYNVTSKVLFNYKTKKELIAWMMT